MTHAARELADEIAAAHSAERLRLADAINVRFSSGGLAFAAKGQPTALIDAEARLVPTEQRIEVVGSLPRKWKVAIASGGDLADRLTSLHRGRRRLAWQPEDVGVFAAGALWTYLTIPLHLADAAVRQLPDRSGYRRLRVRLPGHIAGHGAVQTLHVDDAGLIARHDYTATAFGRWARAAQRVGEYRCVAGIPVATARRVTPRMGPRWPAPRLVWITIDEVTIDITGTSKGEALTRPPS